MSQLKNIMSIQQATPQPEKIYFDYACADLGVYITSSITKIEAKYKSKGLNNLSWLCGTRVSNTSEDCFTVQLIVSSNAIASRIKGAGYSYSIGDYSILVEYEYNGVDVKFNGSVMGSPNVGIPNCVNSLYIGAINNNGQITTNATAFSGDMYYLRASDANGYVFNFIPWKQGGTLYLKDTVSGNLVSPYYGNFYEADPNA